MFVVLQDRFTTCFKTCGTCSLFEGIRRVQSPFDAEAVQTATMMAMLVLAESAVQKQKGTEGA